MASWITRNTSLEHLTRRVNPSSQWLRTFTTTLSIKASKKPLPPRRKIEDNEIEESFLKGTGPGGQKINKTNSAVQIKHIPTGLVVKCQGTRSRDQNRKDARRLLADKLEEMELGENSRTRLKEKEVARKKASKRKKSLRKYRALAEGNADADAGADRKAGGVEEDEHKAKEEEVECEGEEGKETGVASDEDVKEVGKSELARDTHTNPKRDGSS